MGFKMKYDIETKLLPLNTKRRSGYKINKFIFQTLHDTGNINSTAYGNVNYYINSANETSASAHEFVDDKHIVMCIPCYTNSEKAWHVMYGKPKDNEMFGDDANDVAIGVELCYFKDKERTLEAYKRYIWLIAYNAYYHKINIGALAGHFILDPERKVDPMSALNILNKTYNDLLNDIRKEYYECLTGVRVNFEGKLITIEDSIFSNDKNYIGIREMFEKIGYKVGWDNNTKTVIINK